MSAFSHWTGTVSLRLEDYTGRTLADAPGWVLRALPEWYRRGLSAHEVADRLADCRWPARATLSRFYTDRRPADVRKRLCG